MKNEEPLRFLPRDRIEPPGKDFKITFDTFPYPGELAQQPATNAQIRRVYEAVRQLEIEPGSGAGNLETIAGHMNVKWTRAVIREAARGGLAAGLLRDIGTRQEQNFTAIDPFKDLDESLIFVNRDTAQAHVSELGPHTFDEGCETGRWPSCTAKTGGRLARLTDVREAVAGRRPTLRPLFGYGFGRIPGGRGFVELIVYDNDGNVIPPAPASKGGT